MHFLGLFVLILCQVSRGSRVPVDTTIVQFRHWGVVGTEEVVEQVLLNGVPLISPSQEVSSIIQTIKTDSPFPLLISDNQTSMLRNHTVLRSRECILKESQLHWADRVFYDGKVYLTLDHSDMWKAHVPQAQILKLLWDQDVQRTRLERSQLQEGCIKLMRELSFSEEQSVPGIPLTQFLIPILALLALMGLIIISVLLSKNYGLRQPGGVIGSIIHYPKDMTEMAPEVKGCAYHTL
ncbi:uncharacterized protein LOC113134521 [Mastacembelus armatus]|uniref:uncharacterized protein LOC113134521 n=1 Tax=Mastacembelus armatus TaxID=205130 RepID=UPI000E4564FC|nr:uncharacterized protein LOC113134521 [Mastacembelus armatus]